MIESSDNIDRGVRKGDSPGLRKLETGAINEKCVPRTIKKGNTVKIVVALGLGSTCHSFVPYLGPPLLISLLGGST